MRPWCMRAMQAARLISSCSIGHGKPCSSISSTLMSCSRAPVSCSATCTLRRGRTVRMVRAQWYASSGPCRPLPVLDFLAMVLLPSVAGRPVTPGLLVGMGQKTVLSARRSAGAVSFRRAHPPFYLNVSFFPRDLERMKAQCPKNVRWTTDYLFPCCLVDSARSTICFVRCPRREKGKREDERAGATYEIDGKREERVKDSTTTRHVTRACATTDVVSTCSCLARLLPSF